MSERAPTAAHEYGMADPALDAAFGSPLDGYFPPEKERIDAPLGDPKHEFELEDRRSIDWPRRRAFIIDNLLLAGVFFLIRLAINDFVGVAAFTTSLALSYFFVMEATTGQTIGKRMMRLRVVMRDGRPAPANAVACRTVFRLIDGVPIGAIFMLLSGKRRQRLGDLAARTIVRRDDRYMPRAAHSPLLGVYPMLWIGVALAVMWQVNLFGPHIHVDGKLTSNPYMQRVDKVCERRLISEWKLGASETGADAVRLWTGQMGALDSLPEPPASARHDMRIVKRSVRGFLFQLGRETSRYGVSTDRRAVAASNRRMNKRYHALRKQFSKLGLPHCAESLHGIG